MYPETITYYLHNEGGKPNGPQTVAGNIQGHYLRRPSWMYGKEFIGWFTAQEGGELVTTINTWECDGKHFYARWKNLDTLNEDVILNGGDGQYVSVGSSNLGDELAGQIDFSQVTFEYDENCKFLKIHEKEDNGRTASVYVEALKKGNTVIKAIYNGEVIKIFHVSIESDWDDYILFENWRRGVESQIWTSSMSPNEKADAVCKYIKENFTYRSEIGPDSNAIYAWQEMKCDCVGASGTFGYFMEDAGIEVGYVTMSGHISSSLNTVVGSGHIYNAIKLNGSWVYYDCQPPRRY